MDEKQIIALFFQRSEDAIAQAQAAYGPMCRNIALRLLGSEEDAQECLNDTWHSLWNAIPPERPKRLRAYIARITRNLAMKRLTGRNAQKRTAAMVSRFTAAASTRPHWWSVWLPPISVRPGAE